jgi:D-beta-D-heptose 7-phosphate kinase/D-beta-D-heptose 1-phosphate adenosyltransferase
MSILSPDFSLARVLVLGDLILDKYWHGSAVKISEEAPVSVLKIENHENRAGGAANVALNIASLGAHAVLLGLVGEDDAATQLKDSLNIDGIELHLLPVVEKRTITKLRIINRYHQVVRLDFEDKFDDKHQNDLLEIFLNRLDEIDIVVLSDYAKETLNNPQAFIQEAKLRNICIIVDPKSNDFEIYRGATIVTPNLKEFESVVGTCLDYTTLIAKAILTCKKFDIQAILITLGKDGMILVGQGFEPVIFPTEVSRVSDVTGAGDTVVAVLASALAIKKRLKDAVHFANLAAGICVEKFGTASVTAKELTEAIYKKSCSKDGCVSEEELIHLVQQSKIAGQRIVMTNGCFDVMHAGHIGFLNKAKELGERLIVAVNDDSSVRSLKGANRPFNSLKDRMLMLDSLKSVDWVIPFSEITPERLIKSICPDILVKGSDYSINDIAGGEYVIKNGGEVKTIDIVCGYSTTALIKKIQSTIISSNNESLIN